MEREEEEAGEEDSVGVRLEGGKVVEQFTVIRDKGQEQVSRSRV